MNKIVLTEMLDTVFAINGEMIHHNGEDCYFYSFNEVAGILAVFDGCGGLGSKKYQAFNNKTGAYIASRGTARSFRKWFDYACDNNKFSRNDICCDLKSFIDKELSEYEKKDTSNFKIKGSMVRPFPTTVASAVIGCSNEGIDVKSIWAGDSRVYMIDSKGLAQLSDDDIDGEDALSNLTGDGVLTNVVSADGKYTIHISDYHIPFPCIIFTATDGCFGYIPTPMQFEYCLLISLENSNSILEWQKNITQFIREISGDDHTMCLAAFGFKEFNSLKKYYSDRIQYLYDNYISIMENDETNDRILELWQKYSPDYYRYCSKPSIKTE